MRNFGTSRATALRHLDLAELAGARFPAGSMGPKVEACRQFVVATGQPATIGLLSEAPALLGGTAGTTITPAPATSARASAGLARSNANVVHHEVSP